jgi:hypothetical protein
MQGRGGRRQNLSREGGYSGADNKEGGVGRWWADNSRGLAEQGRHQRVVMTSDIVGRWQGRPRWQRDDGGGGEGCVTRARGGERQERRSVS